MAIKTIKRKKGLVYKVVVFDPRTKLQLTKSCETKSEAKIWESKFKHEIHTDHFDQSRVAKQITLKEVMDEWLESNKFDWENGTYSFNEKRVISLKGLHRVTIKDLSALIIDDWLVKQKRREQHNLKRYGFEKELRVLRAALNWYREYKEPNYRHPILKRHFHKAHMRKQKPLLTESDIEYETEMRRFIDAFKEGKNPVFYVLAFTMYQTGLRVSEAAAIDIETVDLGKGTILVDRTIDWDSQTRRGVVKMQTKTKVARLVFMPDPLVKLLRWWIEEKREPRGTLIFHREGKPLSFSTIQSSFYRAKKSAGIKARGCTHILRHAFCNYFTKVTGDKHAAGYGLGHQEDRTTDTYIHLEERNYREKWEMVNERISQNLKKKEA